MKDILSNRKRVYLLTSVALLILLVIIAKFFNDSFVRPVFGDYLIVLFMYSVIRTATPLKVGIVAIGVLLFSYLVEILQFVDLLAVLGIKKSLATDLIVGSTFDWYDMLAYTLAFCTIIIVEKFISK